MVPGREERALRRLERIESALMGDRKSKQDKGPPTTASQDYGARQFQKGRTSFVGALGRQLLEAVKPALMSALTAGITAKAATGKSDGQQGDSGATASRSTDPSAEI